MCKCYFAASKTLKINIESFARQHDIKITMAKRQSTIFLQQTINFCPDSRDSVLDSYRWGLAIGEEDEIDKEIPQESQWEMER